MTNVPDPDDDDTAGERIENGLVTDAHLDAAIRELDRLHRPEVWSSRSGDASGDIGHVEPAGIDKAAEESAPAHVMAPRTQSLADDSDMGSGEIVYVDDDDQDLFGPEQTAAVQPPLPERDWLYESVNEPDPLLAAESAGNSGASAGPEGFDVAGESRLVLGEEIRPGNLSDFDHGPEEEARPDDPGPAMRDRLPPARNLSWPSGERAIASVDAASPVRSATDAVPEPSSLPRRMFGLKRALDAHRLRVPGDEVPGETEFVEPDAFEPVNELTAERVMQPSGPHPTAELIAEPLTVEQSSLSHPLSEMPETDVEEPESVTPHDAERAAWLSAWRTAPAETNIKSAERASMPQAVAPITPEPTRVREAEAQAEAQGWFGARRNVDPEIEMKPGDNTAEAIVMAGATASAAGAAAAAGTGRRGWFGSRKSSEAAEEKAVEPEPGAPRADVSQPEPPAKLQRKSWFRSRKRAGAEPEPSAAEPTSADGAQDIAAVGEVGPPNIKGDPFAAMKEAIAPKPKRERRGWFGSKRESAAEAAQPSIPDEIDIEPVQEGMQAAALKRAEVPAGDFGIPTAAAGVAGETPAVQSADAARVGVLLVNLGTPDAPTPRAVRRYLREFLSDRRVIEKDTFVWQLVFKGIILPLRPRRKARAYKSIWNQEKNESPLKTITRAQAENLGAALAEAGADVVVEWAMRYGSPAIGSRIKALMTQGCERILIVPLYPQYSSATTATVCDEAFRVVSRLRNQPTLRVAPPYYADPVYIEALASSIRAELAKLSFEPEVIVASYHGMPLEYVQKGDPYLRHCTRTTELLRERLGKSHSQVVMTFQSRFGRAEWLQPYTDQTLRKLAKDGVKSVAVVTPGFAADCLETLEEIAIENAHVFRKKGGKNFAFVPCLNDSERGMLVIREIAARELHGWM